jgi:hypothetical protein
MMDTNADSKYHASILENEGVASIDGCNNNPGGTGGGTGQPPLPPEPPKPPKPPNKPRGTDKTENNYSLKRHFASISSELFGIKSAQADVTPDTRAPLINGVMYSPGAPYAPPGLSVFRPNGFPMPQPCNMNNPAKISHFDLFNRISGVRWRGCVEARPEPYDVTDAEPTNSDANSLFVPYFWPDESGNAGSTTEFNSYLPDRGSLPVGWELESDGSFYNIFKYDSVTTPSITEIGPLTRGPNAACPDELVRLTSNKSKLLAKIDSLSHWIGGGTIVSEGLMWGWRTLSPKAPFADGSQIKTTKKFIILMSDGANTIEESSMLGGETVSDYSAYGYIKKGRFGSELFADVEEYLDKRQELACKNAKAAGIQVYSILFREVSEFAIKGMRDCASSPKQFRMAKNGSELRQVFQEIAAEIMRLRLTR